MNKEMTIVWHDLLEDPNDLPHIDDDKVWSNGVLIQTTYGHQFCALYHRLKGQEEGIWYDKNNMTELNKDTIEAWTYISTYCSKEKRIENLLSQLPVMEFYRIKKGKTKVYPKPGQFVILFQYKEGEGIVSGVGFYDEELGWMLRPSIYVEQSIDDVDSVIGWSSFFEVKE